MTASHCFCLNLPTGNIWKITLPLCLFVQPIAAHDFTIYHLPCIEVRAQFFFSLRFRARLLFFHQFRAQFFFSQILRAQLFFITFRNLGCPSPYAIGAQGHPPVAHCYCGQGSGDCQKWKGCRYPEMHYQPYLRPKWSIPDDDIRSVLRKQFSIFSLLFWCAGLLGRCALPLRRGSGGRSRSQRVLDALRCILSHIWALNELFQMKILPVLRKQFTLLPFHGV